MKEQSQLDSDINQVPLEVINPQISTVLKPKKQNSFRKKKTQVQKQPKILSSQREKQPEDNSIYVGLQNEEKSKNNEKILGPWIRPQIQKSVLKISQVQDSLARNKIKFINKFSQNVFSSKKPQSKLITLNNIKHPIKPKSNSCPKFFMKILSVRKAVLQQEEDLSIQLPKIKNLCSVSKFRSTCSFKELPTSLKSNGNPLKKQDKPLLGRLTSYKSSENLIERKKQLSNSKNFNLHLQRKLNGATTGNFNFSLLKSKNIELHNFMSSSKFNSIIHTKKKT